MKMKQFRSGGLKTTWSKPILIIVVTQYLVKYGAMQAWVKLMQHGWFS